MPRDASQTRFHCTATDSDLGTPASQADRVARALVLLIGAAVIVGCLSPPAASRVSATPPATARAPVVSTSPAAALSASPATKPAATHAPSRSNATSANRAQRCCAAMGWCRDGERSRAGGRERAGRSSIRKEDRGPHEIRTPRDDDRLCREGHAQIDEHRSLHVLVEG